VTHYIERNVRVNVVRTENVIRPYRQSSDVSRAVFFEEPNTPNILYGTHDDNNNNNNNNSVVRIEGEL